MCMSVCVVCESVCVCACVLEPFEIPLGIFISSFFCCSLAPLYIDAVIFEPTDLFVFTDLSTDTGDISLST